MNLLINKALKQVLRLLRIAHDNMSIKDLAKRLDVSAAYVCDIESEKSEKNRRGLFQRRGFHIFAESFTRSAQT